MDRNYVACMFVNVVPRKTCLWDGQLENPWETRLARQRNRPHKNRFPVKVQWGRDGKYNIRETFGVRRERDEARENRESLGLIDRAELILKSKKSDLQNLILDIELLSDKRERMEKSILSEEEDFLKERPQRREV